VVIGPIRRLSPDQYVSQLTLTEVTNLNIIIIIVPIDPGYSEILYTDAL